MRDFELTARPNAVEAGGVVRLYETALEARGYRPSVVGAYGAAVEHFISWLAPGSARLEVDKASVRRFLSEHLPDCKCPGRVQRGEVTVRSALNHLLVMLAGIGLRTPELNVSAHVDAELREFCEYASDAGGLAAATLVSRRQWI